MTTWEKVMSFKSKDTRHKGVANTLTDDEINTIAATVDFFGGSPQQVVFDLKICRYRVFDFIAMCVMGNRVASEDACKVLAHSFIYCDGDIDKFIQDLRETDYDIVVDWQEIEL